jgi:glutamine synthetase
METKPKGRLDLDTLSAEVDAGRIDTVLIAMTDMQGRLQGKRLTAAHFLDEVVEHDAEGCNYLLAVDVEMNTVEGYTMSSWERGYGDFVFKPDMDTLRLVPWQEGTAMVTCDLVWEDGSPVVASPRQILKRQLERLAERGLEAFVGTELEFIVFMDTYEEAWRKGYRDLDPPTCTTWTTRCWVRPGSSRCSADTEHHGGGGARGRGRQGRVQLRSARDQLQVRPALATADGHAIYKNGAKEIAAQEGCSITFMPKFDEREGNSCHIHLSLRGEDGSARVPRRPRVLRHLRALPRGADRLPARVHVALRPEHKLVQALRQGLIRPDRGRVGARTTVPASLRVVGHGNSLRVENRIPAGTSTRTSPSRP